ncbi:MAG: hypothetical protein JWM31_1086 [Solirubrobacterales bacterium]|nr:hypothetical protein [Solirubrobacterales bacterium]
MVHGAVHAEPTAASAATRTLFNDRRFHALNVAPTERIECFEVAGGNGRVIGSLSGVLCGGQFVNGYSAPYGGLDLVRSRETPANVARLVDEVLEQVRVAGARSVTLRLPPAALGESEGLILFTLLNRGFRIERCELNQHLDLTGIGDVAAYRAALKSPARRALGRFGADELGWSEATDHAAWERCYQVLAANRAAKGRRLSLSLEYLQRARIALAPAVRMFELRTRAGSTIAAALIYRVRSECDLVVAWGERPDHGLRASPMNHLALRVVDHALASGVRIVDLGISNDSGPGPGGGLPPNGGLHQFKQSILARTEPRLTLAKELHP